jgi:hypothetical protein
MKKEQKNKEKNKEKIKRAKKLINVKIIIVSYTDYT